jgi:hypothetical protein
LPPRVALPPSPRLWRTAVAFGGGWSADRRSLGEGWSGLPYLTSGGRSASAHQEARSGSDGVAAKAVPALDLVDRGVEQPGDLRECVAALDLVVGWRPGGRRATGTSPVPETGRDAATAGAARSVRVASRVAGARGMMSSWPAATRARVLRLFAAASSFLLTRSFRAIVVNVSPRLTLCQFRALKSSGVADDRRERNTSPVPAGTFTS